MRPDAAAARLPGRLHSVAVFRAPHRPMGKPSKPGWPLAHQRVRALINALAAVLTVIAVLLVRAVLKLALLPFRALRSLWRGRAAPA